LDSPTPLAAGEGGPPPGGAGGGGPTRGGKGGGGCPLQPGGPHSGGGDI
jgi:hypothetical protein